MYAVRAPLFLALLLSGSQKASLFIADERRVFVAHEMSGLESVSLGAWQCKKLLDAAGIKVAEEYEDAGENHYFDGFKDK